MAVTLDATAENLISVSSDVLLTSTRHWMFGPEPVLCKKAGSVLPFCDMKKEKTIWLNM
nr:MAG TPA: hypothetical protein [Caudoviricetes sp.]